MKIKRKKIMYLVHQYPTGPQGVVLQHASSKLWYRGHAEQLCYYSASLEIFAISQHRSRRKNMLVLCYQFVSIVSRPAVLSHLATESLPSTFSPLCPKAMQKWYNKKSRQRRDNIHGEALSYHASPKISFGLCTIPPSPPLPTLPLPSHFFAAFLSFFVTRCGVTGVTGVKGMYGL